MFIYYILLSILAISLYKTRGLNNTRSFVINSILIFLVIALRDASVGIDTSSYIDGAIGLSIRSEEKSEIEILWTLLLGLVQEHQISPNLFLGMTAILEMVPLVYFINKVSEERTFSLFIFVIIAIGLCFYMTGIRQSIATSFGLCAIMFFDKKKYLWSGIFLLICIGFHASSIFLLLCVPFLFIKYNEKVLSIIVIISALVGFVFRFNIFESFGIISRYLSFIEFYSFYNSYEILSVPNFVGLCAAIIPPTMVAYLANKTIGDSIYVKLFILGVVLTNLFVTTPTIERYFMYVTMLEIILIPSIFKKGSDVSKILMIVCLVMIIVLFFNFVPESRGVEEYKFFQNS